MLALLEGLQGFFYDGIGVDLDLHIDILRMWTHSHYLSRHLHHLDFSFLADLFKRFQQLFLLLKRCRLRWSMLEIGRLANRRRVLGAKLALGDLFKDDVNFASMLLEFRGYNDSSSFALPRV